MTSHEPFARILLLKHHRRPAEAVLAGAVRLVRRARARLTFAHTLEGGDQIAEASKRQRLRELEALLRPHLAGGEADYLLLSGDLAQAARQSAGRFDLVVPAEGEPGSEAEQFEIERLLRHSPIPVWLQGPCPKPEGILAAVDIQSRDPVKRALNLSILRRATHLSTLFDAQLDVLSVLPTPAISELLARRISGERQPRRPNRRRSRQLLQELLAEALSDEPPLDREPRLMLAQGDPDQLIRQAAESASVDLLVAGSLGRSGLAGWLLGNTAERLFRELGCTLLAVTPSPDRSAAGAEERSRAA